MLLSKPCWGLVCGLVVASLVSLVSPPALAFPLVSGQQANFRQGQIDWAAGFVDPVLDTFFGAEPPSSATLFAPADVHFVAATQTLIVSDTLNRRVLVFDAGGGGSFGGQAMLVLGQPDAVTGGADPGNPYGNSNTANPTFGCAVGVNACGVRRPFGLALDSSQRLFVADPDNRRVIIWNLAGGGSDGMAAEWALGQATLATDDLNQACGGAGQGAVNGCGLAFPSAVALDEARGLLFVADTANNRVLLYDVSSLSSGMVAIGVIGQANLTSRGENVACGGGGSGATNACGLAEPGALAYDPSGQALFVADFGNRRVVRFDLAAIPANGPAADAVIGQPDFATGTADTSCGGGAAGAVNGCGLGDHGVGVALTPTEIYVSDTANHRVLSFPLAGLVDGQAASGILGQATLTVGYNESDPALGGRTDRQSFVSPQGMSYDPAVDRLFVTDAGNHRVMVFGLNVGGVAVEATGDIASASAVVEGDGAITMSYETGSGDAFEITLPAGSSGPSGEAIAAHVYSDNGALAISIEAELPPGETKSVTVPALGNDLCIVDKEVLFLFDPILCLLGTWFTPPANGVCLPVVVGGEPGDNPNNPFDILGLHTVLLCRSSNGATVTVSGLLHSSVAVVPSIATSVDRGATSGAEGDLDADDLIESGCTSAAAPPSGAPFLIVLALLGLLRRRTRNRRAPLSH